MLAASYASKFILIAIFATAPQAHIGTYETLNDCLVAANYVKDVKAKLVCVAEE